MSKCKVFRHIDRAGVVLIAEELVFMSTTALSERDTLIGRTGLHHLDCTLVADPPYDRHPDVLHYTNMRFNPTR